MRQKTRRSCCPVACSLDLLGDKWTLLVVRDLLHGRRHFRDFLASPERISTNILADRLAKLRRSGLAEKYPSCDLPGREAYRLTAKGKTLAKFVRQLADWGLKHIEGTEQKLKPN